VTTKPSFFRNSAGFTPATLARLALNFCTNLEHTAARSRLPPAASRIFVTSSVVENGFSAASSRASVTRPFATSIDFCALRKSWNFPWCPTVFRA